MNTFLTARFASVTAVVFALFLAVTSSVSEAAVMGSVDSTHQATTELKEGNALEAQSIALLAMGILGLVAVRRMQKA